MRHNLRIRLGTELIASLLQKSAKLHKILNNSVVNHRNGPILIEMGMCIHIRGLSVSRPAGMTDADGAGHGFSVMR